MSKFSPGDTVYLKCNCHKDNASIGVVQKVSILPYIETEQVEVRWNDSIFDMSLCYSSAQILTVKEFQKFQTIRSLVDKIANNLELLRSSADMDLQIQHAQIVRECVDQLGAELEANPEMMEIKNV